ncbi:hypothetical protein [Chryseobacterium sediminis]|uniref:hypothetical protein n=1 Tax=Chryseobacterium sediminis TaxID=1679494 RepID=UPI002864A8F5|nr:hypothetical protein [Chryseobacterium sediminis]MDR6464605.1 hypothetical protein [Chryseobacterium sediminis]
MSYPLTPDGVKQKQAELFQLSDDALQQVAIEMAADLKSWVLANFVVTQPQQEYYEAMEEGFRLVLGWQTATSILCRDYVEFGDVPFTATAEQKKARSTTGEVIGNVSYSPGSGWQGNIGFTVKFAL